MNCKQRLILTSLVAALQLLAGSFICLADEAVILQIRPEYLPNIEGHKGTAQVKVSQRDPFAWPETVIAKYSPKKDIDPSVMFSGFQLESIMHDGDASIAIINGSLLSKGGTVKGAKVVRIDRDAVTLVKAGLSHTLKLGSKLYSFKTTKQAEINR